jgi:acetylornithine deacetylase/succinyl-diaminopimelate desuccinylase-like protein
MAAMLAALFACGEILDDLSHEVWFAGLAGEEAGQHGAHALAARETFDLVIAGEPTGLDFVYTHKGSMFLTLTTRGQACHAASPHLGRNAIFPMAEVAVRVREEIAPWLAGFSDPVLGASTISVGTIQGGSKTNIVPDFCQMTLDVRTVPAQGRGFEEELFSRLRKPDPQLEIRSLQASPLYTHPEHPLLAKLQSLGSRPVGAPWFCDAAVFAQKGSPAIAMGPGSIAQAHTRDEWIAVADLEAGAAFFQRFLRALAV